jgi:hypothetical protein
MVALIWNGQDLTYAGYSWHLTQINDQDFVIPIIVVYLQRGADLCLLVELHAFDNETCRYAFSTTRMIIRKGFLISSQPLLISISLLSINFMAEFCCEIIFMLRKSCILCPGRSQHSRWFIEFCRSFAPRANPIAMPYSLKLVMRVNGIWRGFVWVPKLFKIPYSYSDG